MIQPKVIDNQVNCTATRRFFSPWIDGSTIESAWSSSRRNHLRAAEGTTKNNSHVRDTQGHHN